MSEQASQLTEDVCILHDHLLLAPRTAWINAIEFLAGSYYIVLALLGFRNMYIIFYRQQKYATVIFPLMYMFA